MILMTMKLILLHHVRLGLQASTLATTLGSVSGATPAPAPAPTPMLSFFAFSFLCRSLRCLRAIQFAVPARFAFFPTVFAHVNRNVWRLTMLQSGCAIHKHTHPYTPIHKHTHTHANHVCTLHTILHIFLSLACTCNAALFNIKWRLIPGSTSSQSTHIHTHTQNPFLRSHVPLPFPTVEAVKCSSTGGCHWGSLYVCRLQR